MPPSVLHLLTSDQRRGAESFGRLLSERLADRGWTSECVALTSAGPGGLDVEVFGESRFGLSTLRALRRRARHHDVVVAHGSSTLPASALALTGAGVPFVYVNIGDPRYWVDTRAKRMRVRAMLGRAARIVAISPTAAEILVRDFGLPAERVPVIPNGRPTDVFRPADADEKTELRRQLGLPVDATLVAAVGALAPEKRVDVMIDAIAARPEMHLVLAGNGPLEVALRRQAGDVARGRVHFLGGVDRPQDVLRAADVYVLTSDSEGVPGALIEAGLCGLPAVATHVGFVSDVVHSGVTGFVVPPGQPSFVSRALDAALRDRRDLGLRAREQLLDQHDLDGVVAHWDRHLMELVHARAGFLTGT